MGSLLKFSGLCLWVLSLSRGGAVAHYENPSTGCDADEKALTLDGGSMCAQACGGGAEAECAAVPAGTTAKAVCGSCLGFGGEACEGGGKACQDAKDCPKHMNCERNPFGSIGDSAVCVPGACMLLCQADEHCPKGATCSPPGPDGGVCMFHDSGAHYGPPSTGCDADEKALTLDGGGMCAQACGAEVDCGAAPAGTTAKVVCGSCLGFGGEACEGGGKSCEDSKDCPADMNCEKNPFGPGKCVPGACMLLCQADEHCPEGATCSPPSPDGGVCMFHDKKKEEGAAAAAPQLEDCLEACLGLCKTTRFSSGGGDEQQVLLDSCITGCRLPDAASKTTTTTPEHIKAHCGANLPPPRVLPSSEVAACEKGAQGLASCLRKTKKGDARTIILV